MNTLSHPAARTIALATAAFVAATTTTLVGAPAGAAEPRPVPVGAGWLSGELSNGLLVDPQFDFADYGLSIDAALAFSEVGQDKRAKRVTRAVAASVRSYTTGVDFGSSDVYAGATAKAATLAIDQGRDPESFGGVDLVAQLEGLVQPSGRIADRSDFGDFANVIGQTFAVSTLTAVTSPRAKRVTSFLLKQQCEKGYFRLSFSADASTASSTDESCDDAAKSARQPDTDATALAALALLDVKGEKAERAAAAAIRWLVRQQGANGSFGGGTSTEAPNTNSTGLAGWALLAAGEEAPAAEAAAYVRGLQVAPVDGCGSGLEDEAGAVAYDNKAWRTGDKQGITDETRGQWWRASAQALPVLQAAPQASGALDISGRSTGAAVQLSLTGVAPGERVCVIGGGSKALVVGRWTRTTTVTLDAPDAAAATYRVVNAAGTTARVQVTIG